MSPSSRYNRRERPAKPALTRDGIVSTATELMLREGIERVTMRRLAQELDTGPASLYVYVSDTDELHGAVLDGLLGEVDIRPSDGDWRERLWQIVSSYRTVLFAHPSLARVALVTPLSGPNYLAIIDAILALLAEGGMTTSQAAWAVDMLLLIATAAAVEHGSTQTSATSERDRDQILSSIRTASADAYPHIAAASTELVSGTGESRSRWAFDALLNGAMETTPPNGD